jgi:ADP-ribosylglycohydrolase
MGADPKSEDFSSSKFMSPYAVFCQNKPASEVELMVTADCKMTHKQDIIFVACTAYVIAI